MSFRSLVAAADRVVIDVFGDKSNGEPVTITYAPEAGAPVQVTGLFDQPYVLVKGSPEAGVEALEPSVFLRLEDLPVDPEDDEPTLTIGGVDYVVTNRRPDGAGGIVLALRRAS